MLRVGSGADAVPGLSLRTGGGCISRHVDEMVVM